jgi:hypothetical protein
MSFSYNSRFRIVALIIFCLLSALVVGGEVSERSFRGFYLNKVATGGLSSDGWIGDRVNFSFPGFASWINSVELRFDPVRIGASEPARVAIASCGGPEREFNLEQTPTILVPTSLGCGSLSISARALNFFKPEGGGDNRNLGVRLVSAAVVSPFKLPIIKLSSVAGIFLSLLSLALLAQIVAAHVGLPGARSGWIAVIAALAFVLVVESDPEKLQPLIIFLLAALAGMALYSYRDVGRPGSAEGGVMNLLALALGLGAFLRLYGIKFGLPSNFHPDEVPKVNAIMRMYDGKTLDPQYFLHPSLLLYLTYATNKVLHLLGLVDSSFRESAFLAGRVVSFVAGMLSIFLTYLIGRRLFSTQTGGLSALLLAVFPLHVTCSRYLKEDALLTFVALSCVYATIVAVQTNRRWILLFAGILAGCTAGTKYSGILMVAVPASAPWISSRRIFPEFRWIPWAVAAVAIAPIGFFMTTPYSLLNSAKFLNDFGAESRHMQTGHTVSITAWSQLWMYHFWRSIWPGTTGVVAVVSCIAFGFLLRRGRLEDLIVIGMALLFYLPAEYVKAKPAPQPERYILPCLPFIAIGIAEFTRSLLVCRQRALRILATVSMLVLVLAPLLRSALLAREVANDTRDQLASWMKENLPHGSKVLMDWKPYCPTFHGEYFDVQHIPRARIILELNVNELKRTGADYLVLSSLFYNRYFSQPNAEANLRQRFRDVFQKVPVIKQVEAPSGPYGFHNPTLTLFSLKADDFRSLEQELQRKDSGEIQFTSNEVRARAKW